MFCTIVKLTVFISIWNSANCWTSTSLDDFPYHVSAVSDDIFKCNAAIIHPLFAVTSATCGHRITGPNNYIVSAASNYRSGGLKHNISKVFIAPNYDSVTHENDIALVRVDPPFDYPAYVLVLPKEGYKIRENTKAVLTAWTTPTPKREPMLQRFNVKVLPQEKCDMTITEMDVLDGMVCTQYEAKKCIDDIGAPLVTKGNVLIGVMTMANVPPCKPNQSRVYTEVAPFADLIRATIERYGAELYS